MTALKAMTTLKTARSRMTAVEELQNTQGAPAEVRRSGGKWRIEDL
jgi:hypothetical protein